MNKLLSDDIVISVGVIVGLAKLLLVVWRVVSMIRSDYNAQKEQHKQRLKKAFTHGENLQEDYEFHGDGLFKAPETADSFTTLLDTMPAVLRVPSMSLPRDQRDENDEFDDQPRKSATSHRVSKQHLPTRSSLTPHESMSHFIALGEKFEMKGLRPFRIDDSLLISDELVAKGSYGEVWRGRYNGATVAIKTLVSTQPQTIDHVTVFVNEIRLMVDLHHSCVCQVLGASWQPSGDIKMVMEFMPRGDLTTHLAKTTPSSCGWDDKVLLALDIADGLAYVHHRKVIHRDLKSRNVLLCDRAATAEVHARLGAKITDFGLSRTVKEDDENASLSCGVGTYRWMAPELFLNSRYTSAVDVYSFGMILSEMDSHQVPFWNTRTPDGQLVHDIGIMDKVRRGELRPKFSSSCPEWIEQLGMACVDMKPSLRPTAEQIKAILLLHVADSSLFE
ncbi:hypothetical protein DYB32_000907 [Aphanomyces invadans]|uniref:Protein kinase domain-containing protein n=1 Tax=Aphanomyces invadans TaxID=157072 RepID=A0A418B8G8_9STRA|nr:hypothetical protein DYB32_000907 [Aphanomyces invadans]